MESACVTRVAPWAARRHHCRMAGLRSTYDSEVIRLADLATTGHELVGYTFTNCLILGPGLLAVGGTTELSNCDLGGPNLDALFWVVTPEREVIVGPVLATDCRFLGCRFQGVGFAGPPELRDKLLTAISPGAL